MKEFSSIFHEEVISLDEGVVSNLIKSIFGKSGTNSKIKKTDINDSVEKSYSSLPDEVKESIKEFYNEGDMKKLSKYTLTKSKLSENNNYYKIALVYSINSLLVNGAAANKKYEAYYTFYNDICYIVIGNKGKYNYYLPIINTDPDPNSSVLLFVNK